MRAGILTLRHDNEGHPRGMYCGMGVCYECLVTVDDVSNVRACMTTARDGMIVSTDA
jgi:aerobic-type carbon monoxide dehydrogenase small subunit (CoxS/CutS family)